VADDAAPPAPDGAAISTPYLVQLHDGSTATYYAHTDRPPTQGEVAQYAASQGQAFAGFPTPAPEPAAPSPAPQVADAPNLASRAWGVIAPKRSLGSEGPSIGGAIAGGMTGAEIGAPFLPPFGSIAGGLIGAGVGGGGGEALRYGAEKVFGWQPAEEGTLGQRVTSAGIRGTVGEAGGLPLRGLGLFPMAAARPVANAVGDLAPVLTGTAERVVPELTAGPAAEVLGQRTAADAANRLPDWWAANAAGKAPGEVAQAWAKEGVEKQAQIAGEHLPAMQTVMGALEGGATPWAGTFGGYGKGSLMGTVAGLAGASPRMVIASSVVPAYDVVTQGARKGLAAAIMSPKVGVPLLKALPTVERVAGPIFGGATRAAGQSILAPDWPPATTIWPTPPS
jgi:uncharacterized protein (DUF697 family)